MARTTDRHWARENRGENVKPIGRRGSFSYVDPEAGIPKHLTEDEINKFLKIAENLASRGKRHESETMYYQILQSYPGNVTAALAVSHNLTIRHRFDRAYQIIEKAVTNNPKSADLWRERAKTALNSIWNKDQRRFGSYGIKGEMAQLDDAQSSIQRAIKLEPKNYRNYKIQSDLFRRMGETKLEIKSLQKAVKLDPKDADIWVKLALYEKNHKKAIILLKRALKQNPISKEVIFEQLFWRYTQLDKFSEAISSSPSSCLCISFSISA